MTLALLAPVPAMADTEWQIRPFLGLTFGGGTTLVDPDHASGRRNIAVGIGGGLLGEIIGVEMDVAHAPGFFQGGDPLLDQHLVSKSSVTTFTGNVIVGLPRRRTEYGLRPYFVGGLGTMRARSYGALNAPIVTMTRPALDIGGGVFGSLSDRTGLSWELRHFRSVRGRLRGQSFGPEKLTFWRANMALVIRY